MKLRNTIRRLRTQAKIRRLQFFHWVYRQWNRRTILFIGGLAGTAHETLIAHSDRPTLLILFAAMMGLPAFLAPSWGSLEERRRQTKEELERQLRELQDKLTEEDHE